jgi:hypothetical protein
MAELNNVSHMVYKLSSRELNSEVNLKPEAWRVLAQINGARTVAEIANSVGMDLAGTARTLEQLAQAGLVTREFARVIGPMANIIIEDELAALEESREQFPRERIAEFVEGISAEIRDDTKRTRFQQIMLEAIRKL